MRALDSTVSPRPQPAFGDDSPMADASGAETPRAALAPSTGPGEDIPALAAIGLDLGLGFCSPVDAQTIESRQADREAVAHESTKPAQAIGPLPFEGPFLSDCSQSAAPNEEGALETARRPVSPALAAPSRAAIEELVPPQTTNTEMSSISSFGAIFPAIDPALVAEWAPETVLSPSQEALNTPLAPSSRAQSLSAAIGAPARALFNTAQSLRSLLPELGLGFGPSAAQTHGGLAPPRSASPDDRQLERPIAQNWPAFDSTRFEAQLPQGGLNAFWAAAIARRLRAQTKEFSLGSSMAIFRQSPALRMGLVGSSIETFDPEAAKFILTAVFDSLAIQWTPHAPASLALVGGLTDIGLCAIGYRLARERSWSTRGVAAFSALSHPWFEVDQALFAGEKWGDESLAFLNEIDVLVRVGGGTQARKEEAMARARGLAVLAIEF